MIERIVGLFVIGLLLVILIATHGCIASPQLNVPIDQDTCEGVYTTALVCHADGYEIPPEYIEILKETNGTIGAGGTLDVRLAPVEEEGGCVCE